MARESFESALDRLLTSDRSSRRAFVGRTGSAALATSLLGAALSACGGAEGQGGNGGEAAEAPKEANHPKTELGDIVFSNWPLYIDKKVIKSFNKETGASLKYKEEINDNTEFFGKVRQPLQQGDAIGRDLVALTDWMAARWIRLGYTEPIDKKNTPNVEKNLQDNLRSPKWDPGRNNSIPWQSGQTAIGYNKKEVGEITSLKALFDPKYKGKVSMFGDARDTTGLVMLMNGVKPEDASIEDVLAAVDEIDKQNRDGQIRRFTGNDYTTDLTKGNVVIAMAYSGDMIQLKADNPELDFVIPEEGAMLWSDNMMIPQKAEHPYGAEVWMNYVYEPEVAAKIAAYVNYVSPVKGAQEILMKTEPELASNEMIFPPADVLARCSGYPNLSVEEEQQMNEAFEAVIGA
jgi:spermidine/putrescine transport system substrate-binding protein